MDKDFSKRISSKALNTLYKEKFNKSKAIPLADDILKLIRHLKTTIKDLLLQLKEDDTNATIYNNLSKAVGTYLLVFNRRRPGELQRMVVADYNKKRTGVQNDEIAF